MKPLSALDYKLRKDMQIELKRLQAETGITFIFVTHDQEEALTMSDRIAVMSAGKIQQIGSPREIYDEPVNRFVADFIGETNFLTGTLRRVADGMVEVDLSGGGVIMATLPKGAESSGEVTVVLRPEHAFLAPKASKSDFGGKLVNIVYFGTDTHYHISLPGGATFIVREQNKPHQQGKHQVGDLIGIQVAPNAARVLRAD